MRQLVKRGRRLTAPRCLTRNIYIAGPKKDEIHDEKSAQKMFISRSSKSCRQNKHRFDRKSSSDPLRSTTSNPGGLVAVVASLSAGPFPLLRFAYQYATHPPLNPSNRRIPSNPPHPRRRPRPHPPPSNNSEHLNNTSYPRSNPSE